MAPYASIVIPTHDRASTLPWSIRSAQAQTVRDIEIVVAGDGATPAVREIAESFARSDPRIRFSDRPKEPFRGVANRDRAVRAAAAERIFYNDDDDLLLPRHVELLGAALDKADVVDTPAVSVQVDGAVSLALSDSAHPEMKRLLIEDKFKGVFDTHLAHSKEVYLSGAGAWMAATDRRVVWHMLKFFALDPAIRWTTLQRVTALSFHGAGRTGMPDAARAAEIAGWFARIGAADFEEQLRREGGYAFHVLQLLGAMARAGNPAHGAAARKLIDGAMQQAAPAPRQLAAIEAVRDLADGICPEPDAALSALEEMIDARVGPYFTAPNLAATFAGPMSPDAMTALLARCRKRPALSLLRFHLAARQNAIDAAMLDDVEQGFRDTADWTRFYFGYSVAQGLSGRANMAAWDWIERVRERAPHSHHALPYWRLRQGLAQRLAFAAEADAATAQIDSLADSMT